MAETEPVTDPPLQTDTGNAGAVEQMLPLIYEELRRIAHRHLQHESTGITLTTTDLVHEAYIRLADQTRVQWTDRAHFMAVAATAMRRILVDHARAHSSVKAGGGLRRLPLDALQLGMEERADLLVALDEALARLRILHERQARVVECRFFGGMTEEETAEALGVGLRTVKRDWARARTWLYQEIYGGQT